MSRVTHEWVMSHIWMRHINESCPTYKWVVILDGHPWGHSSSTHVYTGALCMSRVTHEWVMSHIWMPHINEVCHKCEWVMCHTHQFILDGHPWGHSNHTHDQTGALRMSRVTHEGVLSHIDMPLINESCHTCEWVMSHKWRSHVSHTSRYSGWAPTGSRWSSTWLNWYSSRL